MRFVFSVYRLVSRQSTLLQALPFVLSHGSRNPSIIEFRKKPTLQRICLLHNKNFVSGENKKSSVLMLNIMIAEKSTSLISV